MIRYTRSPSDFWDSRVRPSFLRTTPAKNPRTECGCQPVAFMMAGMVAPAGRLRRPRTAGCLELAGAFGWAFFPVLAALGGRFAAGASFAPGGRLGFDMCSSLHC